MAHKGLMGRITRVAQVLHVMLHTTEKRELPAPAPAPPTPPPPAHVDKPPNDAVIDLCIRKFNISRCAKLDL